MIIGCISENVFFGVWPPLAAWWRLRSPNYNNNNNFCNVNTDGSANNNNARNAGALAPGFCDSGVKCSNRQVKDDPRKRRNTSLGGNP